jgi:sugar phosphate isomerase/epimerase
MLKAHSRASGGYDVNRITLAPTTLPSTPPLEFIQAAVGAGFEGLGFRLHKSPAYPNWVDWTTDAALRREVKQRLADSGQEMVESLSYYLLPEMDWNEYAPSLEYAAELGATYALVIGRDQEWSRQREHFGQICDLAARYGLIAAIEAPVGTLSPIGQAFQVIEETGRKNAVVCIDPTAFLRACDTPEVLRGRDPALLPYTQINDGKREGGGRLRPGDGDAGVDALLDALPAKVPVSLEWPAPRDSNYSADEWARLAIAGTRRFLSDYYATRAAQPVEHSEASVST